MNEVGEYYEGEQEEEHSAEEWAEHEATQSQAQIGNQPDGAGALFDRDAESNFGVCLLLLFFLF